MIEISLEESLRLNGDAGAAEEVSKLRRDAERWQKISALMFIGNVELNQDDDGGYIISVDPVENIVAQSWSGNSPEEAIDAAPPALNE